MFSFGGAFIDFVGQLVDGRDVDDALMMTGFHLAVEGAFVLVATTFSPANIVVISSLIAIMLASIVNTVIDNYMEPYFRRQ